MHTAASLSSAINPNMDNEPCKAATSLANVVVSLALDTVSLSAACDVADVVPAASVAGVPFSSCRFFG